MDRVQSRLRTVVVQRTRPDLSTHRLRDTNDTDSVPPNRLLLDEVENLYDPMSLVMFHWRNVTRRKALRWFVTQVLFGLPEDIKTVVRDTSRHLVFEEPFIPNSDTFMDDQFPNSLSSSVYVPFGTSTLKRVSLFRCLYIFLPIYNPKHELILIDSGLKLPTPNKSGYYLKTLVRQGSTRQPRCLSGPRVEEDTGTK